MKDDQKRSCKRKRSSAAVVTHVNFGNVPRQTIWRVKSDAIPGNILDRRLEVVTSIVRCITL
jgi:hypothetical protein